MNDLRELYQEMIIDHGRNPRNFGTLSSTTHEKEGFNPLCGDKIHLFIEEKDGMLKNICFQGSGCAISMASASLMTEAVKQKTRQEANELFLHFHQMVMQNNDNSLENMGKLAVLKGVAEFPARVKCATLAWHTLQAALNGDEKPVSTE